MSTSNEPGGLAMDGAMSARRTPHSIETLLAAGESLAEQVRTQIPHSPRPVFLHYIAQTFDALTATLWRGGEPHPSTPAQQLCLHLMIARAENRNRRTAESGHDFARVRAALLPDNTHEQLAAVGRISGKADQWYDFAALGVALTAQGMSAFFAPFEPDDLVA